MSRNDIFNALLAIGQAIEPSTGNQWLDIGRQMKAPENAQCPALFQVEGDCDTNSRLGQMNKRVEQVTWVIYLNYAKDQATIPAVATQDLKDAIEAKLGELPSGNPQTLGGLVYAAYIDGAIRRFPGDLDGLELLTVPIKLLLP